MTEEEYIEMCAEKAREEAKKIIKNNLKPFKMVKEYFVPGNMTKKEFKEVLKDMETKT